MNEPVLQIAQGLAIPFLGTVLGAACVFFMKKQMGQNLKRGLLSFAAGVMVMYNVIHGRTFFSHIISLGTYYLAIATLASTNTRVVMPRLVPEAVEEELQ